MDSEVRELFSSTIFKIHQLKKMIDRMQSFQYASENPKKLSELIKRACIELEKTLNFLFSEYENDPKKIEIEVKMISGVIAEISSHVRFVEGSRTEKLPWSLIRPFETMVEKILGKNPLILRPQWSYNYVFFEIIEPYKTKLFKYFPKTIKEEIFKGCPDKLFIISFPGFERLNILQHVILAHEVGHKIGQDYISREKKDYVNEIKNKIVQLPKVNDLVQIAHFTQLAIDIRNKGLQEILSDLVSLHFFGVAALLTLNSFSKTSGLFDVIDLRTHDYHPPWRYRLRIMAEQMDKSKFLSDLVNYKDGQLKEASQNKISLIKQTVQQKMDLDYLDRDPILKIAYESVKQAMPSVQTFLKTELSTVKNALNFSPEEIEPLVDRLKEKIIPNQIKDFPVSVPPVNIQEIIVAAWLYKIAYVDEKYKIGQENDFNEEFDTLNRLVLKAIEINHLQHNYPIKLQ